MTRDSIREYTEAIGEHYLRASNKEKRRILDAFVFVIASWQITVLSRKSEVIHVVAGRFELIPIEGHRLGT